VKPGCGVLSAPFDALSQASLIAPAVGRRRQHPQKEHANTKLFRPMLKGHLVVAVCHPRRGFAMVQPLSIVFRPADIALWWSRWRAARHDPIGYAWQGYGILPWVLPIRRPLLAQTRRMRANSAKGHSFGHWAPTFPSTSAIRIAKETLIPTTTSIRGRFGAGGKMRMGASHPRQRIEGG
jgi:hypothetical protein